MVLKKTLTIFVCKLSIGGEIFQPTKSFPINVWAVASQHWAELQEPLAGKQQLSMIGLGEKELEESEVKILNSEKQGHCYSEDLGNGLKLEMMYIPAGSFLMGAPASEEDSSDDERPQHQVRLTGFYLGKYQVTQGQYQKIMEENPSHFKSENRPVENVSWHQAQEFCQKLRHRTGKSYGLPSESQWEYACRGATTTPFCFGETITPNLANYDGSNVYEREIEGVYRQETTEVGQFSANEFGLYDMHGNVWEWCEDSWHENYQGAPTDGRAWLTEDDNDYRLLRGGSWDFYSRSCRSASRYWLSAHTRFNYFGFRVVVPQNF